MAYPELKDLALSNVKKYHDELFRINCHLADNPEISGKEKNSSEKFVRLLEEKGFVCEYPYGSFETAFRAISGNNNHKYKIAILAEYDALPGIGHACGHCLSGAISCLAGLALSPLQDELDIDIHIIGTPGEEAYSTKGYMIDEGLLSGYDMAMMVHLYNQNVTTPTVLALSAYDYEFFGKPAHSAAAPWEGVNAFNAAQLQFHAIDMFRQHIKHDARIHGIFMDGGKAPNIVPDYVRTRIFIRAETSEYKNYLVDRVDKMAEGACLATGCTWKKYTNTHPADDLRLNQTGDRVLQEVFAELGLELCRDKITFGSSDVGCVSYICPTFHPLLKIAEPPIGIHMTEFADLMKTPRAEEVLDEGAMIIALQIIKIFSDSNLVNGMKADFDR